MSKKIIFIHGSPRKKGNTSAVSRIAIEAARSEKAEVTEIDITQLKFNVPGCAGCMECQQSKEFVCMIRDQLSEIVFTLPAYDVIAIAAPTYWMSYPAQIKMLIDRMGSLMKYSDSGEIHTPLAGKVLSILTTGNGDLKNNLDLLEQQWRNVAYMLSCNFTSCLIPNVPKEIGTLIDDPLIALKAQQYGKHLAS